MSLVKISGNASGTGTLTIAAPNTNTNYTLTLPTASGTFLTNSGTEAGAFSTLSVNSNNISAENSLGFRNRIINGDMRIDQRNAGASVTGPNGYQTVDRFGFYISASNKFNAQQNAGSVTPPTGFVNYLGITSSSAYSVLTADFFVVQQTIEGTNIADLAWGTASAKTVTLSFWVRSSLTGTFGGGLANSAFNRSYPFTYSISAANTWEQKTITITGDTSGTWLTTNGIGIRVMFGLGVGSTGSGTAGSWSGVGYYSATGATSVVGTNGATFYITGVQLEVGSVATPFERRDYGRELAMCQRYFQRATNSSGSTRYLSILQAFNTTNVYGVLLRFPVTFRATPSISISASFGGFYNSSSAPASTSQPGSISSDGQSVQSGDWGGGSGLSAGQGLVCFWNANSYIEGSAEL